MKRLLPTFVLFIFTCTLFSQTYNYGNQWINYSQQYFKIKLHKEGIYRLDSTTLSNAGVPLSLINARNLQVFINGEEQFVYLPGENDGVFNQSDFLEFYGKANDASFDSSMYVGTSFLPNPWYSVVQDTASAFLTWNNSLSNKRYSLESDTSFSNYTALPYFFNHSVVKYKNNYSYGGYNLIGATDPRYTPCEGWAGPSFSPNSTSTIQVPTPSVYSSGPTAKLTAVYLNLNADFSLEFDPLGDHHIISEWKDLNGSFSLLRDSISWGFKAFKDTASINPALLGSVTEIRLTSVSHPNYNTQNTFSSPTYASVWYPQTFNLQNKSTYTLYVPDATQSKSLVSFTNFQGSVNGIRAFDLSNGKIVIPVMSGNSGQFLLPNAGGIKKVLLTPNDSVINVTSLNKVNGTGYFTNYQTQSGNNSFVIVTHSKLMSAAQQYKTHRQSLDGGGYNVVLADIDDLYDQFAFGINKHPKSVRNFIKYLSDSFPSVPSYLFLLGKSVTTSYGFGSVNAYNNNLVPSWGNPPADNLITAGLNGTYLEPLVPTGRLSAYSNAHVLNYLEKIIEHDTMSVAQWQKNVIHFVGGSAGSEIFYFSNIMNSYKAIISDTSFGGNVTTFTKTSSQPVQTNIPDSIIDLVNAGASLLTFYGHGSNQSFDFDINDPTVFDNKGRYPILLSNSCYSGNIHLNDSASLSERYVLIPDKGTVGFIASVSLGVAQYLEHYSRNFYRNCTYLQYGAGVGDLCKGAIINTQYLTNTPDSLDRITCMEMTLHGDPSVRINKFTKPDYSISNSDLYFNTTIHIDSIQVNLRVSNLARAVNDTIYVKIARTYPDGTVKNYLQAMKAPYYVSTLSFFIPADAVNAGGLNLFSAQVDLYNDVDELDNIINNQTTAPIPLLINAFDLVPVYPYEFQVLPLANSITLKASTVDPFSAQRNYLFQLDTTDKFINPIAVSGPISASGGIVEWTPNLLPSTMTDSIVYYWRVSRDSINAAGYNWRTSSFQTIDSLYGWEQAHFFQFKKDRLKFVNYNEAQRLFEFADDMNAIDVHNGFYPFWGGNVQDVDLLFSYNSHVEHAASWNAAGWTFVVIDSVSGLIDYNEFNSLTGTYEFGTCYPGVDPVPFYDFGNYNNTGGCHFFPQNSAELGDSIKSFLNSVGYGKYVLGYSNNFWRGLPKGNNSWAASVYAAFDSFGVSLTGLPDTIPIVFLGRKGLAPGTAHIEMGISPQSVIDFKDSIAAKWDHGFITSTVIGPAYKWESAHWRFRSLENNSKDTVSIHVVGIKVNGLEDTLMTLTHQQMDVTNLDTIIDAAVYPYLKLVAEIGDDSLNTAPQLSRWHVISAPAPEGALNASAGFTILNDSLQEGDSLRIVMPFKNISNFVFRDSLIFTYQVEDENHQFVTLSDKLYADSLLPGATIMDTISIASTGFPGANGLWIDVNPNAHPKYQWEDEHFNNVARIPFTVNRDNINPILDVTFDAVHIMNKDIVSARPEILITLKDENQFLALNDTADFEVYLTYPASSTPVRIWFNTAAGAQMQFVPAQLPKNSCKITFNPSLMQDGVYTLQVKAKDRSSNESGANAYKIQFTIENKPSVTQVMNYPNPFSTSTKFVFTLTGSEVPEQFMIQIMTISGKVVREIKRDELGFIHIGRNITEYSWDGRDEFGDLLANGVYLYRVVIRLNGEKVEHRETAADQYFTKELGKMVIMR